MKARDIMTRKVHTAVLTTPVQKIAQMMIARKISGVPVVDRQGRILGIVTEGDLLRRAEAGTARRRSWWSDLLAEPSAQAREYVKSRATRAQDVMTRPVLSVTETTDVAEIADLMERQQIKRVPVVRGGKLVGIASRRDLLRALAKPAAKKSAKSTDAAIRDLLKRKLETKTWLGSSLINFSVEKGNVELTGLVSSPAQQDAVRVMAENIPGVRQVKNRLTLMPKRMYAG